MKKKHKHKIKKKIKTIVKNIDFLIIVVGIVMIWRGIWNFLDHYLVSDFFILSNVLSILLGVFIIFLHDFNLKKLKV